MDTLAHDLFLLMLNLSQLNDRNRILSVFIDALDSLPLGVHLIPCEVVAKHGPETVEIATRQHYFGCFEAQGLKALPPEHAALVRNAFQMLALVLENRAQAEQLASENQRLVEQLQGVLRYSPSLITIFDMQGRYLLVNPATEATLGILAEDMVGKTFSDLFSPDIAATLYQRLKYLAEVCDTVEVEDQHNLDGTQRCYVSVLFPLFDVEGQHYANCSIATDITERKQAEERVLASLKEKETLLKEIHHRVKNNLQVVASLLSLQAKYLQDPSTLDVLRASQDRIRSMAIVHERLYESLDLARIDFASYVRKMVRHLIQSYGIEPGAITLDIDIDDIHLGIDQAIPCGLIVNELVSNSFKHAFPLLSLGEREHASKVEVCIQARMQGEQVVLTIGDNGVGFPKDVDWRNTPSLGMQLVMVLTKQIDGTIELDSDHGATFRITFANKA